MRRSTATLAPTVSEEAAVAMTNKHRATSASGLDHNLLPMKLWKKSKALGTWDPEAIDFSTDREHWLERFDDRQREALLHLTTIFLGGEEAATLDLLPLVRVMAREGRLEEEMYLTAFLWEEAKHVEAFRRWIDAVPQIQTDLGRFYTPAFNALFDELSTSMRALLEDISPIAQARASATYNMVIEGTLLETGYHGCHEILEKEDLMPGLREILANLIRDESRHTAYGVFLLSRLVAEHGDPVWEEIVARMSELLPMAIALIDEVYEANEPFPFDLSREHLAEHATGQFQKRLMRIARARKQSLQQVLAASGEDAIATLEDA